MTPSLDELGEAVAAGVLTPAEAERLRIFIEARRATALVRDTEDVRFVRGFHDIFMRVGLVVLLFGLRLAAEAAAAPLLLPAYLAAAAFSWALAEIFTARQRLMLPSIVLAGAVVFFTAMAALKGARLAGVPVDLDSSFALIVAVSALAAALTFRLRFRLPFATLLVAATLTASGVAALAKASPSLVMNYWTLLVLTAGLSSFAVAMRFDLRDPTRETLLADNAFWLHLLAAPLIVHSLVSLAIATPGRPSGAQAGVVIAIVAALALVALVVDRRALLLSGLTYLGAAISALITRTDIDAPAIGALTLVVLGGFVVALGAGWAPTRRLVLAVLPKRLTAPLAPAR